MTKEKWEEIKKIPEIPAEVWWEYYKECGGYLTNFEEFIDKFRIVLSPQIVLGPDGFQQADFQIMGSEGKMKVINTQTATRKIYEYYDNQFKEPETA